MSTPVEPLAFDIVPVLRRDLGRVVDLWLESTRYHASLDRRFTPAPNATQHYYDYLLSVLVRRDHHLRVARGGGEFLGFCLTQYQPENPVFPNGPVGFISDLAVTARARKRGVGRALTDEALDWLRQHGVRAVQVTVAVANPSGQHFWRESMGFRPYMDRLWLDLVDG